MRFTNDAHAELSPTLAILSCLFNPATPFVNYHRATPLLFGNYDPLVTTSTDFASWIPLPSQGLELAHLVNAINIFGEHEGFHIVREILLHPEQCCIAGLCTFMSVMETASIFMTTPSKQEFVVPTVDKLVHHVETGLMAGDAFKGFREDGDGENGGSHSGIHVNLLALLQSCKEASRAAQKLEASTDGKTAMLQREIVLRLLQSSNFTRQLAGVKELNNVLQRSIESDESMEAALDTLLAEDQEEEQEEQPLKDERELQKEHERGELQEKGREGGGRADDEEKKEGTGATMTASRKRSRSEDAASQDAMDKANRSTTGDALENDKNDTAAKGQETADTSAYSMMVDGSNGMENNETGQTSDTASENATSSDEIKGEDGSINTKSSPEEEGTSRGDNVGTSPVDGIATTKGRRRPTTERTSKPPVLGAALSSTFQWIKGRDIVRLVLGSNLHQSQYVDAAQKVLVTLLRYKQLDDRHVEYLWHITEDATTFEDIKVNVYGMLAALAPHVDPGGRRRFFDRIRSRIATGDDPDFLKIFDLLKLIACHDKEWVLATTITEMLCDVLFDAMHATVSFTTDKVLVDVCAEYENIPQEFTEKMPLVLAAERCVSCLMTRDASAVSAMCQLAMLLDMSMKQISPAKIILDCLNDENQLLNLMFDSLAHFLKTQKERITNAEWENQANNKDGVDDHAADVLPNLGPFDHITVVKAHYRLLKIIAEEGTYYINFKQLCLLLDFGTCNAITTADTSESWNLLFSLLLGSKEIEQSDGTKFFKHHLCHLHPDHISTFKAWRTFITFMFAVGHWEKEILPGVAVDELIQEIRLMETSNWNERTRKLLREVALNGEEKISRRASSLLAQLVAFTSRRAMTPSAHQALLHREVSVWREELLDAARTAWGRLPETWHESPQMVLDSDKSKQRHALQRAQRAMNFLSLLIEQGYARALPSTFAHAASYRDSDVELDVRVQCVGPLSTLHQSNAEQHAHFLEQDEETAVLHGGRAIVTGLKNLPLSAATKNVSLSMPVILPRNSYIGTLRMHVANMAYQETKAWVSPSHFRILSGVCID